MYYAIDRRAINDAIYGGANRILWNPPGFKEYEGLDEYPFDPEKAKALLAESGVDLSKPIHFLYANELGDGQPIVCVHTAGASSLEYQYLLPLLAERLEASSDYRVRRAQIARFNATHPVIRRGIAMTPVKFGISFNAQMFNQAGALVHVYTDGSVMLNHGGTEMGQGLHTKVMQVVADGFGLALDAIRISSTDTSKVPNTSATAASTGSDLNGKAAQDAHYVVNLILGVGRTVSRNVLVGLGVSEAAHWGALPHTARIKTN